MASCLTDTIRWCTTTPPDLTTASTFWNLCTTFCINRDSETPEGPSVPEQLDLLVQLGITESLLKLLAALLPMLAVKPSLKQADADTSGSSSKSKPGAAHSHSAAAGRAARVLRERRLTEAGPFSPNLLCVLGCTLHLLDAVCTSVAENASCSLEDGSTPEVIVNLARSLQSGQLLVHLDTALAFLLRCVRSGAPEPTIAPALHMSAAAARTYACQSVCNLCSHIFQACDPLPLTAQLLAMRTLPARFMEKLCCVACEGLPADDPALFKVSIIIADPSLQLMVEHAAAEGKTSLSARLDAIRYIPAMHVVSRRVIPYAVKSYQDLDCVLNRLKAVHPEVSLDNLLSLRIRDTWQWQWPEDGFPEDALPKPLLPGSDQWVSSHDDYFVPRVRDDSLRRLVVHLAERSVFVNPTGSPICATSDGVYVSRLTAVLLSLQREGRDGDDVLTASDDGMKESLLGVARYVSSLTVQLLHGTVMSHRSCACEFDEDEFEEEEESAEVARAAAMNVCLPCSGLAEGILAMFLQLLAMHGMGPVPKSESEDGES